MQSLPNTLMGISLSSVVLLTLGFKNTYLLIKYGELSIVQIVALLVPWITILYGAVSTLRGSRLGDVQSIIGVILALLFALINPSFPRRRI